MDPESQAAQNAGEGITPAEPTPAQTNNTPGEGGESTPQGEPAGEPQGTPNGEPNTQGAQKPNRIERRFQQMSNKIKEAYSQPNQQGSTPNMTPPWALQQALNQIQEGEMSTEQLRNAVAQVSDLMTAVKAQQLEQRFDAKLTAIQRGQQLDKDVSYIETRYPKLNPDSDNYDEKYSSMLVEQYEKASKLNPDLRLSEFVDGIESLVGFASERRTSEVSNSLAKQAAEGAITPNTGMGSKTSKKFEDLSIAEMEAKLGKVY